MGRSSIPPIIGSGLSRTGTRSIYAALIRADIPAVHYPFDSLTQVALATGQLPPVARSSAILDLSSAAFFETLADARPGSVVLHTTRDKGDWLFSVGAHYARLLENWSTYPARFQEFSAWITERSYGSFPPDEDDFARAFDRHEERVDAWSRKNPGHVLTANVFTGSGYSDVGRALGCSDTWGLTAPHVSDDDEVPLEQNDSERTLLREELRDTSHGCVDETAHDRRRTQPQRRHGST